MIVTVSLVQYLHASHAGCTRKMCDRLNMVGELRKVLLLKARSNREMFLG